MDKECLLCRESIKGRTDKKFCSDACRNTFNNQLNSVPNKYVRNVNGILKRNRRILESLVPQVSAKASKSKLLQKGFDLSFYTHIYKTHKGNEYYFCYEYGYLPLENDTFYLVKRKASAL